MNIQIQRFSCLFGLLIAAAIQVGCSKQISRHGYVVSSAALEQIHIGSSKAKVDVVMGRPSVVSPVDGDVYYYISETRTRDFFGDVQILDRRVLVIYFDEGGLVSRIANYGLLDGYVVDFIAQKKEKGSIVSTLHQILSSDSLKYSPFSE